MNNFVRISVEMEYGGYSNALHTLVVYLYDGHSGG